MSFLKYRDKIFSHKKQQCMRNRITGQLKSVSSCTDCRAWSNNPYIQREYVLESFSFAADDSHEFHDKISLECLKTVKRRSKLKRRKYALRRKFVSNKKLFASFIRKSSSGEGSSQTMGQFYTKYMDKQHLEKSKIDAQDELDNLRNLVKDLNDQVEYLEGFKKENTALRIELQGNESERLSRAEEEIQYLSKKLDIYSDIEQRYETLVLDNNILKEQHSKMLKSVYELEVEKQKLLQELLQQKDELYERNSRALVVSNAIVDNKVLKERVMAKNDKIQFLLNVIENQEYALHDMTLELQNIKTLFSYKEEKLLQNLSQLRVELNQESYKTEKLENQLGLTEELVKELENVRNQFRISNNAMAEQINTYKKQLNTIRLTSENLLTVVKDLKFQLTVKDKEIKKLSMYSQSAMTVIYFSHLGNVLNSIDENQCQPEKINDAITYMKKLLKQIKTEIWNTNEIPECFHINNIGNQTELEIIDNFTQYDRLICEKYIQTSMPYEYIVKYNQAQILIKQLTATIKHLENSICNRDDEINSLESRLISCIEEKAVKICQVEKLKEKNKSLQNQLVERNKQLEQTDLLLVNTLNEISVEKELNDYDNALYLNALDSTFVEYNTYISVLETFINFNEKNINIIYNFIVSDINSDRTNIIEINEEINKLSKALSEDKIKSQDLCKKINFLMQAISQQNEYIDLIETKLSLAESTIDELQSTRTEESGYTPSEDTLINKETQVDGKSLLPVKKSSYSKNLHRIIRHYKREKQELKKKILNMKLNIRRISKFIKNLRKKLYLSEKIIADLHAIGDELTFENKTIQEERICLLNDIEEYKNRLEILNKNMNLLETKNNEETEEKLKIQEALIKLLKKFNKYKSELAQSKKEIANFNKKYIEQEKRLENEINQLKATNNENLMIIKNFQNQLYVIQEIQNEEEKAKQRTVSNSVQVNIEDTVLKRKNQLELQHMKEHYDRVIKTIEKEYFIKNEKTLQQHLNNLKTMKDTYERDIKFLKKTHNENIAKIQLLHEEELNTIKTIIESKSYCEKSVAVNFSFIEIEKLKENYMKLLDEKEVIFIEKIEEIKIQENKKYIKEKEFETKIIKDEMNKNLNRLRRKFSKHQKKIRQLYERKITGLHDKYKVLIEEQIKKITINKTELVDNNTQCDEFIAVNDEEYPNIPVKEIAKNKIKELGDGDAPSLKEVILVDLEETKNSKTLAQMAESQESFQDKCESFLTNEIDLFPMQDIPNDDLLGAKLFAKNGHGFMLKRMYELERELFMKNQEIKRNTYHYETRIKQEQMKTKELASLLDQEMNHNNDVQCRLGLEYNRSEQLLLEKESLKNKCSELEIRVQEVENLFENEKTRSSTLMNEIEKLSTQGEHADQLELSLLRLRHKLDQALECEQRLTLELRKEIQHKKQIEAMLRINDITKEHLDKPKQTVSKCDSNLKVIFIQQCGILHTWSKQLPY